MKRTRSAMEKGESEVTWKRTGDKDVDLMHLYETGQMHDCTIKVGNEQEGYQEFQCHKVILGGASSVLQTLLFEKESQDPSNPYLIKDVAPNVFDITMKFIYGGLTDFGDASSTLRVLFFAYNIKLRNLLETAKAHLMDLNIDAADVFLFFSLFLELKNGNEAEIFIDKCWTLINNFPEKAFGSSRWLNLPKKYALKVLQSDKNKVAEPILFRAALHWALQTCDPDCNIKLDEPEVKSKLNSVLKCIRFGAFTVETFLSTFEKSGTLAYNVLSTEEKLKILSCIATKSPDGMPTGFCRNMESRERVSSSSIISAPYTIQPAQPGEKAELFTLCFSVDKEVNLILVLLRPGSAFHQRHEPVKVTMLDPSGKGEEEIVESEQRESPASCVLAFTCSLNANRLYKLHIPKSNEGKVLSQVAKLNRGAECVHSPCGLNVTFYTQTLHALVTYLAFSPRDGV